MDVESSLVIKMVFDLLKDDYIEGRLTTSEDLEKEIDDWLSLPAVQNFLNNL